MNRCVLALLVAATAASAQQRDFLTADEVDQLRITQEPSERLALYTKFAQLRIDQIEQIFAKNAPGRSAFLHDLLDDYTKIIDAIDTVADDALKRKRDIAAGMKVVSDAEKEMLAKLQKISDSDPKDISRYEFSLKQAIETTGDSLELAQEDLNARGAELAQREAEAKKIRESMMQPKDLEEKKVAEKKVADTQKKQKKAPSLKRKEEK